MKILSLVVGLMFIFSCGAPKKQALDSKSASQSDNSAPSDYNPRIGVAVQTDSRTCLAIHNSTLASGTRITLVSPVAPQSFTPATIAGVSSSPCPIAKEVEPDLFSYALDVSQNQIPKLAPLIAAIASPSSFRTVNDTVEVDLNQNGRLSTFRACDSDDGVHLTMWSGNPLNGVVLWRGYYYEAGNPGTAPNCLIQEVSKR